MFTVLEKREGVPESLWKPHTSKVWTFLRKKRFLKKYSNSEKKYYFSEIKKILTFFLKKKVAFFSEKWKIENPIFFFKISEKNLQIFKKSKIFENFKKFIILKFL